MVELTNDERIRYDRQLRIPEIGTAGQKKLKEARVFIAGLGGLGSISAQYMAAAGIGHIVMADPDRVTLENLNRQLLYRTQDIGWSKVDSAVKKLAALNPTCHLQPIQATIRNGNAVTLTADSRVILDATENLSVRRALNYASIAGNIPYIFGGVDGWKGMVSTFIPGKTSCLECLFSGQSEPEKPIAAIGPVPGMVASIQSLEAIKLILGHETTSLLAGWLLIIDGKNMTFNKIKIEKNPDCPICSIKGSKNAY